MPRAHAEEEEEVEHAEELGSGEEGEGEASAGSGGADGGGDEQAVVGRKRARGAPAALDPAAVAAFNAAEAARGVVYLPRLPPFMKPTKIRHLLSHHGEIGRIYLAPEEGGAYRRRVASGGNKKVMYTEGWVEFADKHVARDVAALLHNTPVGGGKKGGFYASDMWSLRYLRHFKWHHLTEKQAYEKRVRALALRAELSAARKEAERYVGAAETARNAEEADARKAKRAAAEAAAAGGGGGGGKGKKSAGGEGGEGGEAAGGERPAKLIRRLVRQREVLPDKALEVLAPSKKEGKAAAAGRG
jgi:ESF2/ABP1 family protein